MRRSASQSQNPATQGSTGRSAGPHDAPPLSRDFNFLWVGQTLSAFGNEVTRLALPVLAITVLGASAADVGVLSALAFLPFLVLGLPAGVWLSGMDRRLLLIVNDLGRSLVLLTLAVLVVGGFATSAAAACRDYGVVIGDDGKAVLERTAARRASPRDPPAEPVGADTKGPRPLVSKIVVPDRPAAP